jgi:serine/threonine protein kinase
MAFCTDPRRLDLPAGLRLDFPQGTVTVTTPLGPAVTSQARLYRTTDLRWLVRALPASSAPGEARTLALMRQAEAQGVRVPLVLATRVTPEHVFELMEHLPGPTYLEWAARQSTVREKLTPLAALCRALARTHRQGVVHCDVKAEHLVMDGDAIVLLDWGVATRRWAALVGCTHAWAPQRVLRSRRARALLDCVGLGLIATMALQGLTRPRDVRQASASALFRTRFRPCLTATQLADRLDQLLAEDPRPAQAPRPAPAAPPRPGRRPATALRCLAAAIAAGLLWNLFR